ncbi:hypothetical protein HYC85_029435 [Camellia sinensis]|uniref:Retrotransposon gag domain-containing protein n=1 Tax=Camellia sinensis TaxID=4442 RepID=A0A7J7G1X0_CAMSI|nr:hypothetical protein HYC85_029435 [Camellia sinensis]
MPKLGQGGHRTITSEGSDIPQVLWTRVDRLCKDGDLVQGQLMLVSLSLVARQRKVRRDLEELLIHLQQSVDSLQYNMAWQTEVTNRLQQQQQQPATAFASHIPNVAIPMCRHSIFDHSQDLDVLAGLSSDEFDCSSSTRKPRRNATEAFLEKCAIRLTDCRLCHDGNTSLRSGLPLYRLILLSLLGVRNQHPVDNMEDMMRQLLQTIEAMQLDAARQAEVTARQMEIAAQVPIPGDTTNVQENADIPVKLVPPQTSKALAYPIEAPFEFEVYLTTLQEEMAEAFVAQYSYNTQIEVTTRDLEVTRQEPKEGFSDFVTWWRAKASMMTTQPAETDQIRMVIQGFRPTLHVSIQNLRRPDQKGASEALKPRPLPNPLPPTHNPAKYCAFHQQHGHDTDLCFRLRHEIKDLIDNKVIAPPQKPNVTTNPLPPTTQPSTSTQENKPYPNTGRPI